jgi:hypothetical protein
MIESLEHGLLAAWSGLAFIPLIGYALEAMLAPRAMGYRVRPRPGIPDEQALYAGLQYELEMLP